MPPRREVWVAVECGNVLFRGRISSNDLRAITRGAYSRPFVLLNDVHWVDPEKGGPRGGGAIRIIAYGRDGMWRWHTGAMYVRPGNILSIAELRDCSSLLERPRARALRDAKRARLRRSPRSRP